MVEFFYLDKLKIQNLFFASSNRTSCARPWEKTSIMERVSTRHKPDVSSFSGADRADVRHNTMTRKFNVVQEASVSIVLSQDPFSLCQELVKSTFDNIKLYRPSEITM